jgi:single-strand DNA-binding protein
MNNFLLHCADITFSKEFRVLTYNRVQILTRLTRDPEARVLANGGKVVKIGCVVDGSRKKNQETGKWDAEPVWLDVEAWDRGETGRMASLCEERLRKGSNVFVDGKLKMDQWTGQDGSKRTKLVIVADDVRFLDDKPQDGDDRPQRQNRPEPAAAQSEDLPF